MTTGVIATGTISTTLLTSILTIGGGVSKTITTFALTNETANPITVTVYALSKKLTKVTIPAGIGKSTQAIDALGSYSQLNNISLQASSAGAFNYLLTGRTSNV